MEDIVNFEIFSGCFSKLPSEELEYLANHKTRVSYLKGETLFKQGAFAPHVLFINKGYAITYLQITPTKRINIHLASPGDIMALSVLFENNTYQYSAVAISDLTLCMIEKEALSQLLMRNPDIAMQIMNKNNQEATRHLEIIKNISYKQMRGKLAAALVYLSKIQFSDASIYELLNRKMIADFAGISVESTVKFLKEFETEQLIALKGKEIEILNDKSLYLICLHG